MSEERISYATGGNEDWALDIATRKLQARIAELEAENAELRSLLSVQTSGSAAVIDFHAPDNQPFSGR